MTPPIGSTRARVTIDGVPWRTYVRWCIEAVLVGGGLGALIGLVTP